MLLITCPYCGPRPEIEFRCGGEAHIARPADPEDFLHWYTEKTATRPDSPTVAAPKPRDGRSSIRAIEEIQQHQPR